VEESDHRWREVIAGEGERSQAEESDQAIAGGGKRPQVEGSNRRRREATTGGEKRLKVEESYH
jgi:hypothetical protein